jgi:imidazolonepropionase-like amidohydrolase
MSDSQELFIQAGLVFDGIHSVPIERGRIHLRGDEIESVGAQPPAGSAERADIQILDFPNGTALPGLVDVHTHLVLPGDDTLPEVMMKHGDGILLLQAAENARRALFAGVTTMADMGARNLVTFTLRDAINMGLAVGPRLVLCGRPVTRTGGHCWFFNGEADGPSEIRQRIRQLFKQGADVIKVMATGGGTIGTDPFRPTYLSEELEAATDETHAAGKKAAAHCSATIGIERSLAAKFDMIFHAHFYEPGGHLHFQPDLARRLADSPVYINPTLQINRSQVEVLRAKGNVMTADERRLLDIKARRYAGQVENVGKLVQHGVKMIAGSDAGWGPNPFGDFVSELEAMVSVGMTPPDVLLSATRDAACALGFDHMVGTLEQGKKADVLIVDGNPTRDIGALRKIRAIVLGGNLIYKSESAE